MIKVAMVLMALGAYDPSPAIRYADSFAIDAFGRARVSETNPQIHVTQTYDKNPQLLGEATGGTGAATFQTGEASTLLTTAADGDYAIQQTMVHAQYQVGQSQQVKITFSEFLPDTGVTKTVGQMACSDTPPHNTACTGIYLSSESDGNIYFNITSQGTVVDRVVRSAWDDPLDGTGPSGRTADFDKSQILYMDYQWLGVGRVRASLVINGSPIVFHQLVHDSIVDFPYMNTPNLPIRWAIHQSGAGAGTFRSICAEASTEGPKEFIGTTRSVSNGTDPVTYVADTDYAVVGIRLASDKRSATVIPLLVSLLPTTSGDEFEWKLCLNPTVASTFTYSAITNSPVEAAVGTNANTVSDCTNTSGKLVAGGYGVSGSPIEALVGLRRQLGYTIDGTMDELVLVIRPFSNVNAMGSLTWEERY
jgi:hypothetical protein